MDVSKLCKIADAEREKCALSMKQLSRNAGLSPSTFGFWMQQRNAPTCTSFEKLLNVLGLELCVKRMSDSRKAEARVLTREEVLSHVHEDSWVWVERSKNEAEPELFHLRCHLVTDDFDSDQIDCIYDFDAPSMYLCLNTTLYQQSWRVWSVRPTDDQRKAVSWE